MARLLATCLALACLCSAGFVLAADSAKGAIAVARPLSDAANRTSNYTVCDPVCHKHVSTRLWARLLSAAACLPAAAGLLPACHLPPTPADCHLPCDADQPLGLVVPVGRAALNCTAAASTAASHSLSRFLVPAPLDCDKHAPHPVVTLPCCPAYMRTQSHGSPPCLQVMWFEGIIVLIVILIALLVGTCCMHLVDVPTRFAQPEQSRQHND